jgi:type 1 fimbria pilin
MKHWITRIAILTFGALLIFTGGTALADGATGVAVQPLTPQPGGIITVKGEVLGPNREVEVRIIGTNVNIDLGEVETDAEGDFTAEFHVPEDLLAGTYQVQVTGDATATTTITVIAPGTVQADPMSQSAPELRQRPLGESIILVTIFGVLAAAGIFLAQTANRRSAAH